MSVVNYKKIVLSVGLAFFKGFHSIALMTLILTGICIEYLFGLFHLQPICIFGSKVTLLVDNT